MGDDDAVVAGSLGEGATITNLSLDVADDATFRDVLELEDVADGERSFGATHDGLTGEHAFSSDEEFADAFVLVRMTELNASERSTSAGIVSDFFDRTTHVAVALTVVEGAEASRTEAAVTVNIENR